uniref:EF-hand domain-containing protein n=1 Tax=Arcella intermedia TaxID=1963864 RepID=A0A6B2L1V2_9EUKA
MANPFIQYPPSMESMPYKIFKYCIVSIILFIPRVVFSMLTMLLIVLLFKIATIGIPSDSSLPLSPQRKIFLLPLGILVRIMLFFWGFLWIKVRGHKITNPNIAPIIVSNHTSYLDAIVLSGAYIPSAISAKENLKLPLVSSLLIATRSILIDRTDPDSRKNAKRDIKNRATLAFENQQYPQLLIFPEGTCTNGSVLIGFKPGAFAPGLPVQPVCLKYPYQYQSLSWTKDKGNTSLPGKLVRMILQFVNYCEIEYLPPYNPSEEEKKNPQLYANNVRKIMGEAMNVPITDHSYEDVRLYLTAARAGIEGATNDLVFSDLNKLFNVNIDEAQQILTRFAQMKTTKHGYLNLEEFGALFNLPPDPLVESIFNMFDAKNSGEINFKELLIGLSSLNFKENLSQQDDFIEFCFKLFDRDGSGTIGKEEFFEIMRKLFPEMDESQIQSMFYEAITGPSPKPTEEEPTEISFHNFVEFAKKNPIYIKVAQGIVKNRKPGQFEQFLDLKKKGLDNKPV